MPRYVAQPHESTCAAVAIINAGKWLGAGHTMKRNYFDLRCQMDLFNDNRPTDKLIDKNIRRELSDYGKIRKVSFPYMFKVEEHIKSGGAALVAYSYFDDNLNLYESHIALFSDIDDEGNWLGHNVVDGKGSSWVKQSAMTDYFYKGLGLPVVWLLEKK